MKVGERRLRRGAELMFSESRWEGRRSVKSEDLLALTTKVVLRPLTGHFVTVAEKATMVLKVASTPGQCLESRGSV